ncbi:MAG: hypothetical protein WCK02_12855 [Bacteroidota bacterium]
MENLINNIVGSFFAITPIILVIAKHFVAEYITNFTKKLFNSKTKKKADLIFNYIIIFSFVFGVFIMAIPYLNLKSNSATATSISENSKPKTDSEQLTEGITKVINESSDLIKQKKIKDSTLKANREKKLVYQIGSIKENEEDALNLYKRLKVIPEINSSRLFVFKISRKRYFVYKNDEYNQKEINENYNGFKSQIDSIEPDVKIIDLMGFCKLKENLIETNAISIKKHKLEIRCFSCEK